MRVNRKILIFLVAAVFAVAVLNFAYKAIMKRLYPLKYSVFVEQYSQEYNLDKMLIYAVIKCESNFNPNAVSPKDAKGLMQLTDDTFEWVQLKEGTGGKLNAETLFDPQTNIKYGTLLLSLHIKEFSDIPTALAAYNAGRGQVQKWLKDGKVVEKSDGNCSVPFKETEAYINRVLKVKEIYQKLYE